MVTQNEPEKKSGGPSRSEPGLPGQGDQAGRAKAGDRVDRFRIIETIGLGGMGVVYKALDEALGRQVALKHPRTDVKDAETIRARFVREARAASRLLHPNVVPIFEVFEFQDMPWLAMELVEGGSLKDRLKETGPMPLSEVLVHGESLASALAAAHDLDILHRDIKPANVLLDSEGRARLVDFGLVRKIAPADREDEETITRLTEQGHMVGTPGYMSPEQALGRQLDGRSDIFCLGLVLFEMWTGKPALEKAGSDSWLDSLLHTPAKPMVEFRPDTPGALEDIVRKALAKRPEERYQRAVSMATALKAQRQEVETGLSRKRVIRNRLLLRLAQGAVSALLAGVLFAGAWYLKGVLDPEKSTTNWIARPLTHDPAWAADPALSPDETLIAYSSGRRGAGDIWLIDREGGNALQLTDHEAADRRPAWSADGSEIFFTSFRSGEAAIWKVPRLGGTPELVLPDADDPAVSPDGTLLAFVRRNESGHYRIAIAPLDDLGYFRYLTTDKDGFWFHRNPRFSHDGTKIAYNDGNGVWMVPTQGGAPSHVTSLDHFGDVGGWIGEDLVLCQQVGSTSGIWLLDTETTKFERLTNGAGMETQVSAAVSGKVLVFSTQRRKSEIFLTDRTTNQAFRFGDVRNPDIPTLAPDGKSVVFWADVRDGNAVFMQDISNGKLAGKPRILIYGRDSFANPILSPDGSWLAIHRVTQEGQRDIWTYSLGQGSWEQFTSDENSDVCPFFAPDGRYLVFSSDRSGRFQIWRAPVENGRRVGEPERLTFGDTTDYQPKISPDGRLVVWLGNQDDEENLWIQAIDNPNTRRSLTEGRRINAYWWEPGGESLLAVGDWEEGGLTLRRIAVVDGSLTKADILIDFGSGDSGGTAFASGAISLSNDGRLVVHTRTTMVGDVWIMEKGP